MISNDIKLNKFARFDIKDVPQSIIIFEFCFYNRTLPSFAKLIDEMNI